MLLAIFGNGTTSPAQAAPATSPLSRGAQPLVIWVPANPRRGFQFPYLLKLALGGPTAAAGSLLVQTNNTGQLSDDLAVHARAVRQAIDRDLGASVAESLGTPFLMPVFPRSQALPLQYTHALDRDTAVIQSGELKRIDLQLLAMIDDAQKRLRASGYRVADRVLLVGFSASGSFANRFALLHPTRVAAVAVGAINSIAILPQERIGDFILPFPIGTADFSALFGKPLDLVAWRGLPQFLFMGALDDNDAAQYDDAYSDEEKALVRNVLGNQMIPDRWNAVEKFYRQAGANATFKTYENIGHASNRAMRQEIIDFLRPWIGQ